ncbi:YaaA family protein [Malaciobacter mytili]|uniref:YaaA family protein n=1 Tax=Malaciobacter mytili TaxID=603050 RepID=UPI003A868648
MKILLAPAETKNEGGKDSSFSIDSFFLKHLYKKRLEIIRAYEEYISSLSLEELSSWFGLKNLKEVEKYKHTLASKPTMKAIQRYNGVAFDALNYNSLNEKAQKYIDENVVLFSNLFGPVKAQDLIPDYKYKQGAKLPKLNVEKFYLENFSKALDEYLGEEIIDLRAGHYEKFYKITKANVLTFKFIKEGKVISHWAKYYRGILLKYLAENSVSSIAEFMTLNIEGLKLKEIQEKKNIKLLIMEIE